MRYVKTLAVLVALATAATVFADERDTKGMEVAGRITAIHPDRNELTVLTTSGEELKLEVGDRARLELDGRPAALKSFVVGDPVKLRYVPGPERQRVVALHSDATTARDVREKMRATMKTAGKYAYREKEKFQRKMNHALADIDAQIARLQVRAKEASKDARERYDREIVQLKKQAAVAREKLAQAGSATAEGWEKFKKGAASTLEGIGNAIEKAGDRLRR